MYVCVENGYLGMLKNDTLTGSGNLYELKIITIIHYIETNSTDPSLIKRVLLES